MAAASPSPLDFSLKASPDKRPRLHSAGSTHTSPGSSPHSSQSPSSTTHHYDTKPSIPLMNQTSAFQEAFKLFSAAQPPPTSLSNDAFHAHPLAGLLAKTGSLLPNALSALPNFAHTNTGFDFQGALSNSWLAGGGNGGMGEGSPFYPSASLALSTLQRRRRSMKSPAGSSTAGDDLDVTNDSAASPSSPKKLPVGVPDEKKDALYWERRRKNNEAAKRSRDSRRRKEEEVALRAAILEQENLKLRAQVAVLKNETAKLHLILFSNSAGAATPPAQTSTPHTPTHQH